MRHMYAGEIYYWSLTQCAVAAAQFPGYPPTWEGLESLQAAWYRSGEPAPDRQATDRNMLWARTALRDAAARQPSYEQVPA